VNNGKAHHTLRQSKRGSNPNIRFVPKTQLQPKERFEMMPESLGASRIDLSPPAPILPRGTRRVMGSRLSSVADLVVRNLRVTAARESVAEMDDHQLHDIGLWRRGFADPAGQGWRDLDLIIVPANDDARHVEHVPVGFVRMIATCVAAARRARQILSMWRTRAADRRALSMLGEHLLRDIGLTGIDIDRESKKWFWRP
jgi:uncharacterized protein YjiS (DUF1127 family)